MGKISPVSAKYIVHATIFIDGIVDKPDVIGAIFGQTEGLLGADLELRELQRSGRIGRIEVKVDTKGGKTNGDIIIPSSLDKAETAIVGAALEIIQRIGPCTAKIKVEKIEDVRISKKVLDDLKGHFGERLFDTVIRINTAIKEAPGSNKTIYEHAPLSRGAYDYYKLTEEVLSLEGES